MVQNTNQRQQFRMTPIVKEHCATCPLNNSPYVVDHVTTEVGGPEIDVMFIAEGPGDQENQVGRPVVGRTGQILRRIVRQLYRGSEERVAYGNVVRCRPVGDVEGRMHDRPPTSHEASCCRPNILADIQRIKPKHLVLCGKTSVTSLARDPVTKEPVSKDLSVTAIRGNSFIIRTPDGTEYPATATFHFAYVARNAVAGSVFKEDITRAFLKASGTAKDNSARGEPVEMLDTVDKVRDYLKYLVLGLTKNDLVALDYEADSVGRIGNRLLTVGFAHTTEKGYCIPYRHPHSPWTGQEFNEVKRLLTKFFTTREVSFSSLVAHNLKFEAAISLDEFGVYLDAFPLEDTMLRAHAINENRKAALSSAFGLKTLSDEWLGFTGYGDPDIAKVTALVKTGRSSDVNLLDLCEYNAIDCYVTLRLYEMQNIVAQHEGYKAQLKRLGVLLHGPMSVFAAQMERNGIRANSEQLRFLMTAESPILMRQRSIEQELYSLPTVKEANRLLLAQNKKVENMTGVWGDRKREPWLFHLNRQASKEALYTQRLELETNQTAKGRASFDKVFYEKHKGIKEVDLLAEWTELDKLRGTYIEGLYKLIHQHPDMRDGRVRAQFNFHSTATSRTASEKPNMQNIPKGKTASAKAIKSLYVVDPGYVMVCADYSQAEVRWLAEITKDENLLEIFQKTGLIKQEYDREPSFENARKLVFEGDFHYQTASQIFRKSVYDVTKAERENAKGVVFGLIYGMSPFGLAARLGISQAEAEGYQEMFLNQFPRAREWLSRVERDGFQAGYVSSPIGRRRHLVSSYMLSSSDDIYLAGRGDGNRGLSDLGSYKLYEDRVCRNAPIQSIASDTNLMACVHLQRYINQHQKDWRLINIVHDSIIAEVPFQEVAEYVAVTNKIMVNPEIFKDFGIRLTVPFLSDFSVGLDWGHQFDITVMESCKLVCRAGCGASRPETRPVANRRCEECGSTDVELHLINGPLESVMRYLEKRCGAIITPVRSPGIGVPATYLTDGSRC